VEPEQIRFDRFRLDLGEERLWEEGRQLALHPKAFDVLSYLARHPGRRIAKDELLDEVWGERHVSEAVLKVSVREIRKTLGDEARAPRFIETVHRRGYRFIAETLGGPPEIHTVPRPPAAFVGRGAATAELEGLLARAVEGRRQVALVTGEPGIGKSTLVDAFLRGHAGRRWWLTSGQCLEQFGAGEPYLPVLDALGRLCRGPRGDQVMELLRHAAPTWLRQMPALVRAEDRKQLERETLGATPERMLREMAEAVEALTVDTPLVLVLEDLHWSDDATIDLVSMLARRTVAARLMMIATYRPAEAKLREHPLHQVEGELRTLPHCRHLALGYLGEDAVAEYLGERFPGLAEADVLAPRLHRHTEGNPLFLVTALDYLAAEGQLLESGGRWCLEAPAEEVELGVPEGVRQLIERLIDRLEADQRQVLEAASIVGAEPSAAAIAAALDADAMDVEERCDQLVDRRQFLDHAGVRRLPDGAVTARYRFIHSLYQHVLYRRVPAARRSRLHLKIGDAGERLWGDKASEIAGELAGHFERGHDPGRTVRYLRLAAETAVRRYANREAAGHLDRAWHLIAEQPDAAADEERLEVLRQHGLVRRSMGDMLGAAAIFERLAEAAAAAGDRKVEVDALLYLVSAYYWVRRERCLELLDRAAERAGGLRDPLLEAHVRGYCAHWNLNLRGWRDADAEAFRGALAVTREAADPAIRGLHLVRDVYFRCWQGDYEGADRSAREAHEPALEAGDAFDVLVSRFFQIWALIHAGRWERVEPLLAEGIEMAEKNGHQLWQHLFRTERALLKAQAFAFDEAVEDCREGLEAARRDPQQSGQLLFKGLIATGLAHLGAGRPDDAWGCFAEIRRVLDEGRVLMDRILYLPLHEGLSRHHLLRGDVAGARREAERLVELADEPGEPTYLALGRRTLAEVAIAEKRWPDAEAAIDRALAQLDGDRAPLAAWRVHAAAARLHRRRGRSAEAAVHGRRAAEILERLSATLAPGSDLCRSITGRASALRRRYSGTGDAGVAPTKDR
jgi:DNA-binding winged helix-turn-helix (wHTH) protein/tetratricopeptide (TPR) repeat protein